MAAGWAARRGLNVTVLEKTNRTARKVRISGKGRCNVTNARPVQEFIQCYPANGRFLYSALHRFSNQDVIEFSRAWRGAQGRARPAGVSNLGSSR